ncbi:hypothetical protein AB0J35_39750 [Nonomuraea angiospora]|uniref:hypothetical protein n=1 Tax=Nonomuraea angiospora TaxID=46172 RepID=UPI0034458E10
MRLFFATLSVLLGLTITAGCADTQEDVQQGAVQGALSVLGQGAIEDAARVKLTGPLDCVVEPVSGSGNPVDCSGQTQDGKKASVKGTVTSVDAGKGVVHGKLMLTFDGKNLGEKDCVGACQGLAGAVQQGTVQGALSVLAQGAIEDAARVKLTGPLDCVVEPVSGSGNPVDCSGQTQDGKKASVKGTVTSVDADKGVVHGKLMLTFDGKNLGEKECVGVC